MPTTSSTHPSPDDTLQYTNRWIENPSIDLMSPEGTFVRAAMESLDRVGVGAGGTCPRVLDTLNPRNALGEAR